MQKTGTLGRRPSRRPRRLHIRGQSLVEFALIAPLLALLLIGALDFGRVFFSWVQLTNAARVGANYAAMFPDAWGTPPVAGQQAYYADEIRQEATGINCALPSPLPAPTFPGGNGMGSDARVQLSCNFTLLTPLMGNLVGNPFVIRSTATFPIRSGCVNCPGATPTPSPTPMPTPTPSPTPTPGPSATPLPTPTPTPGSCVVPSFVGTKKNNAQGTWSAAMFTTSVTFRSGNGNYTIQYQSLVGGSPVPCNSTITVGPTP